MTCVKTGASVYFYNYGMAVKADVYKARNCYVVRWNVNSRDYRDLLDGDWVVRTWMGDQVWHRDDLGITVVPEDLMVEGS